MARAACCGGRRSRRKAWRDSPPRTRDAASSPRSRLPTGACDGASRSPHLLNDVAVASDGAVYVTDSVAGAVRRVPADRDVFEQVVAPGSLAYPNAIVLAWTGRLFVAHWTGIAIVD